MTAQQQPAPAADATADDPIQRLKARLTECRGEKWRICRACHHGWPTGTPELHAADCEGEAVLALARLAAGVQPELQAWAMAVGDTEALCASVAPAARGSAWEHGAAWTQAQLAFERERKQLEALRARVAAARDGGA